MSGEKAKERLAGAQVPKHLALIPDGNRRWAAARSLAALQGHEAGFDVARKLARFCREIGIHTVTVWVFSTENWKRPAPEVAALMDLYERWIYELLPEAIDEEVKIIHIGHLHGVPEEVAASASQAGFPGGLPESLKQALDEVQEKTATLSSNIINLAVNYGGADEIRRAVDRMLRHAAAHGLDPSSLDIADFLDTAGQPYPNPDLVWRTSGELRISGFLPMQAAYSEMIFTQKFFPELSEDDVVDAVLDYSTRVRRFGA